MSNENVGQVSAASAVSAQPKLRVRRNIDTIRFVEIYSQSQSAKEVAEKMGLKNSLGLPDVGLVNSKAAYLRKIKTELKHFSGAKRRIDVNALNSLIAKMETDAEAEKQTV